MNAASNESDGRKRIEAAVRHIYPRLVVLAHNVLRRMRVRSMEAGDLCQDGVLAAFAHMTQFEPARIAELSDEGLRSILWATASRSMSGRVIDHLRAADRRRRQQLLEPPPAGADRTFETRQDARDALQDMLAHTEGSTRRILELALEAGEVDAATMAERTNLSKAYVYKILQRLADEGGRDR